MVRKTIGWLVLLGLVPCGCLNLPIHKLADSDPMVDAIYQQAMKEKRIGSGPMPTDIVLKEIPLSTPLAKARATMGKHGFSCWSAVPINNSMCLHCTAYKSGPYKTFKVVVKFIYANKEPKIVQSVEVTVE